MKGRTTFGIKRAWKAARRYHALLSRRSAHRANKAEAKQETGDGVLKILIATLMCSQGETGVQTHVNDYKEYLQSSKLDVEAAVVTPFDIGLVSYPLFGIRYILDLVSTSVGTAWYHFGHYLALKRVLRRRVTTVLRDHQTRLVVHSQCPWSARAAIETRRSLTEQEQARVEVVMTVHFNRSQAEEWVDRGTISRGDQTYAMLKQTEQLALLRVDKLVFVSGAMKAYLEERYPRILTTPSKVIHNGIRLDEDPKSVDNGYSGDLISIGTLEPRKNQAFLLKVLALCKERGRHYRLTLVGDGPERKRLETLASDLAVSELVTFAGYVPRASSCIPNHRVYVHAALFENCPIVLLEAFAQAIPVLAYPVGGIPEMLSDGEEGYHWDMHRPQEAADRLISVLENAHLHREMASKARERASQLSVEKVYADMLGFCMKEKGQL